MDDLIAACEARDDPGQAESLRRHASAWLARWHELHMKSLRGEQLTPEDFHLDRYETNHG